MKVRDLFVWVDSLLLEREALLREVFKGVVYDRLYEEDNIPEDLKASVIPEITARLQLQTLLLSNLEETILTELGCEHLEDAYELRRVLSRVVERMELDNPFDEKDLEFIDNLPLAVWRSYEQG